MILKTPLFTDWEPQYIRLRMPDLVVGSPVRLQIDVEPADFQYTGHGTSNSAEILLRRGLKNGEHHTVECLPCSEPCTDLSVVPIELRQNSALGIPGRQIEFALVETGVKEVAGPFT